MQEIKKINLSLDWKTVELKSIADVTMGQSPKSEFYNDNFEGMPFLQGNKTFGDKYPSFELYTTSIKKVAKKSSVLMSVRAPVGDLNIAKEDICIGRGVCGLQMKKGNNEFLYYLLKANISHLINKESGTVFGSINKNDIETFEVTLPEDSEDQMKILTILKNIDKKIEVCRNLNKNLEKTLITIFNSWFINFENYDNSKGMKIDESYGEIPVDWSVEMLEDYVDFVTGVEPGSKNYHEKPEPHDIPFLRVGDLGSRDNGVFIDPSLSKNKILKYDDIVLSLDATIGIVKMGLEGAYSTGMRKLVIKNDNINQPFLYCLVKSNRIQRIIETFATGTTILHAGKSIKHMNFVLSDKKTMDDFGKIGNPIISIILTNLKEIEYLTNLRDTLLPKLMSGEIDVSKINCDLELKYNYMKYLFNQIHTPMSKSVV